MRRVAVFGTGSWGTAFAAVLADAGNDVRLWGRRAELIETINATRVNADYLPDLVLTDENVDGLRHGAWVFPTGKLRVQGASGRGTIGDRIVVRRGADDRRDALPGSLDEAATEAEDIVEELRRRPARQRPQARSGSAGGDDGVEVRVHDLSVSEFGHAFPEVARRVG